MRHVVATIAMVIDFGCALVAVLVLNAWRRRTRARRKQIDEDVRQLKREARKQGWRDL